MKKTTLFLFCLLFTVHFSLSQQYRKPDLISNPSPSDIACSIPLDPDDIYQDNQFHRPDLEGGGYVSVCALVTTGTDLCVGGNFYYAEDRIVNYVAKWDGSHRTALGSGMDGPVFALAVKNGSLYAGGEFMTAGGITVNHIARWDGSQWSALGSGIGGTDLFHGINVIAFIGDDMFAGGDFDFAGNPAQFTANSIARWDGTQWHPGC
jgi:hypothetical protein